MAAYDSQTVAALPATLHPATVYYVARPDGRTHDVFVVDALGAPVAMRLALIKGEPGSQETVDQAAMAARAAEAAREDASDLLALFQTQSRTASAAMADALRLVEAARAASETASAEAARTLAEIARQAATIPARSAPTCDPPLADTLAAVLAAFPSLTSLTASGGTTT
jgi:hypothetical protein